MLHNQTIKIRERWPRGNEFISQSEGQGVQPFRSAHLGMCLKTGSLGRPNPCEEIRVDDKIIEKCLRSETLHSSRLTSIWCMVAQAP